MNPISFALAGAVILTSSLVAFDAFGRSGPAVTAEIVRPEPAPVVAVQARPVQVEATEAPRRAVRVILSSPYDVRG